MQIKFHGSALWKQIFVCAVSFLLLLWKNEKVKEIAWLGWEEKRNYNEGSEEQKSDGEEGGLMGKDEIRKLASTEEMEGKMFQYKEKERARHRRLEILEETRSWGRIVYVNNGRVIKRQLVQLEEMECIRKGADMLVMSGSLKWWLLAGWHQKGKNRTQGLKGGKYLKYGYTGIFYK